MGTHSGDGTCYAFGPDAYDEPEAIPPTPNENHRYAPIEALVREEALAVVRAYDVALNREVLLVRWRIASLAAEAATRISARARAAAALLHPHVLTVYDVFDAEDELVIVAEYDPGTELARYQIEHERDWRAVLRLYLQAGRGLAAAHARGLVHGSFAADQVVVSGAGVAKLRGLAPTAAAHLEPENGTAGDVDTKADQYAFCAALWHALTGSSPPVADLERRWTGPRSLPRRCVRALVRGLAADPRARFATMDALLAALEPPVRQRAYGFGVAVAAAAVGGALLWTWALDARDRCSGGQAKVDEVWTQRREVVREAMLATEVGYAPSTWQRVRGELDRYADAWVREYSSACVATAIERQQPPEVLDLRMACLQRRLVALAAAVDVLASADAQVVQKASEITGQLPGIVRCGDVVALQAATPPPDDPREARAVEDARKGVALARVQWSAGKYDAALAELDRAERTLELSDYAPARAEIAIVRGQTYRTLYRFREAAEVLDRALRQSLAVGADETAAHAGALLAMVRLPVEAYGEVERISIMAERIAAGCGCQEQLALAQLARVYMLLRIRRERPAIALARRALTHMERARGRDNQWVASVHDTLGVLLGNLGRYEQAVAEHRHAIAVMEAAFGPDHPNLSIGLANFGRTLVYAGRFAEAADPLRRSIRLGQEAFGIDHPYLGIPYSHLARVLVGLGRTEQAIAVFRRCLPLLIAGYGSDHDTVATVRHQLGLALLDLRRADEAEAELRAALPIIRRQPQKRGATIAETVAALGSALLLQGRCREGEALIVQAMADADEHIPHDDPRLSRWRRRLERCPTGPE